MEDAVLIQGVIVEYFQVCLTSRQGEELSDREKVRGVTKKQNHRLIQPI